MEIVLLLIILGLLLKMTASPERKMRLAGITPGPSPQPWRQWELLTEFIGRN